MSQAWKAAVGSSESKKVLTAKAALEKRDDDWETDGDFVNDVAEKNTRWGSKTNPATLNAKEETVDMKNLLNKVVETHNEVVKNEYYSKPTFARGYGGKYSVENDRMDKSAAGFTGDKSGATK
ncbi:hypothetical protein BKA69DRAFT_1062340 [Paraphysoderma sedebokerense]|nr:hypothetical protein BKA69DRAFT_1062340 [Paraphysoderma sedebokerense]